MDRRLRALSDEKLVLLAKAARDTDAFGELARRHGAALHGFLVRLCRDEERARDASQSAFVQAFVHIKSFRGHSSFKTWLFKIAYREFLKTVRKAQADLRLQEDIGRHVEELSQAGTGQSVDIARGLERLTENERVCIGLCAIFGLTHEEASRTLNLPIGTIKSHINRGRAKLDRHLNSEINDDR